MSTKPIQIGLIDDSGSTNAALDAAGLSQFQGDDTKQIAQAYIDDINRRGGILGRKLTAVYAPFDINGTQDWSTQEQAMCQKYTVDNHVFAVLGTSISPSRVLDSCLSRAHIVQVAGPFWSTDSVAQKGLPLEYSPSGVLLDRFAPAFVTGLVDSSWLKSKPVIGVLAIDSPAFRRTASTVTAALTSRGSAPVETRFINTGNSGSDAKQASPALQSALLSFRSKGVTGIVVLADIGDLYLLATELADSQNYYPTWAVASPSGPAAEIGTAPDSEVSITTTVGWVPYTDVGFQRDIPMPAGYKHCIDVLKKEGISPASDYAAAADAAMCEMFSFLELATVESGAVDSSRFAAGVATMRGFTPAITYGTSFAGGRHDGATTYRAAKYMTSCTCFRFVTAPRPI